ncbi:MAG: type II toxin-antitoxin system RelE/ParE family toxin [Acetobacteraceae bacterium]
MIVFVSREAESDLESIADQIAKSSPGRAAAFVRELRQQCEGLADMSRAFPLVPRYEHHGIRRRVYGNYLIFYQIGAERSVTLHVLHGAMDYAAILFLD